MHAVHILAFSYEQALCGSKKRKSVCRRERSFLSAKFTQSQGAQQDDHDQRRDDIGNSRNYEGCGPASGLEGNDAADGDK